MSLSYPQFGNPDYSGFTTDEEIARRYIAPDARGSPMIGARMYMPTASMPPPMVNSPCTPQEAPAGEKAVAGAAAPNVLTVSDAMRQIFQSRPVTAFDWVIVFVLILAVFCLFEYARDFIMLIAPRGSRMGGNFCNACGGTV